MLLLLIFLYRMVRLMRKMTFIFGYWPKRRRRGFHFRKRRPLLKIKPVLFFCCLCILGLMIFFSFSRQDKVSQTLGETSFSVPGTLESYVGNTGLSDSLLKIILGQGLPGLHSQKAESISPVNLAETILSAVTTVNLKDPKGLLASQFSYIGEIEMEAKEVTALPVPYNEGEASDTENLPSSGDNDPAQGETGSGAAGKEPNSENKTKDLDNAGDNPLVGIYNTHNSENYSATGGAAKVEGQNSGVVKVAEVLEASLRDNYGVAAARSTQIHDYPNWNLSYTKSKETAKSLLSKNPSIQILVDIHRDAGIKEKRTTIINGSKAAQILFIVGSAERLDHPNWKKNKEFAEKLHAKAEKLYPGLSRGVRVQDGRYNQHLHPHAVLIEVGNVNNSLEEAEISGKLLARIFSEVLKDLSAEKL